MSDLADLFANIDKSGRGVWVQASTLGSLEALLNFLKTSKIPVRFRIRPCTPALRAPPPALTKHVRVVAGSI